jgi:hypothetical protein
VLLPPHILSIEACSTSAWAWSENRGIDRFTGYVRLLIIPAGYTVMVAAGSFNFITTLVASTRDWFSSS